MLLPYPGSTAIRNFFDMDSARLLAHALVSSRLDCYNSLLYGILDADLTKNSTPPESIGPH